MKTLCSRSLAVPFAVLLTLCLARFLAAAEKKDARVTQIVQDVRILTSKTASRSASLNDKVSQGTAVKTGTESRAELTFDDQSLTRLGANTLFSFGPGHDFDLTSGALLICVPKEAGTAHVSTAAVTAAITGGVAMTEYHHNSWFKFIVIEGQGVAVIKATGKSLILTPGEILALPPGARTFTKPQNIDLKKLTDKSRLLRGGKLPQWAHTLIEGQVEKQRTSSPKGGLVDPTGFDAIDQRAATEKTPAPLPTRPPG